MPAKDRHPHPLQSCAAVVLTLEVRAGAQFAATACTIVSGAIAERAKFEAYICYSFFMAAWVYPVRPVLTMCRALACLFPLCTYALSP